MFRLKMFCLFPYYVKIWRKLTDPVRKRQFPINIRSASAVTPSEKSSIKTNRKSTTSFPMSLRWTVYMRWSPPLKRHSKTQKCPKFKQYFAMSMKRYEIGCQFTNRKSHTGFRLVPTSVTLNNLEGHITPVLHYFMEYNSFDSSGWR